jgi:hypothetical protein
MNRSASKIQAHWRRVRAARRVALLRKQNAYRKRVITELWETEKAYSNALQLMIDVCEMAHALNA